MNRSVACFVGFFLAGVFAASAAQVDASAPKGATLAVYDRGFALVNELRSATLAKGENEVRFGQLPARLDPATLSFSLLSPRTGLDVLEQQFLFDLSDPGRLFSRYLGKTVGLETPAGPKAGTLLSAPSCDLCKGAPLAVRLTDGSTAVFPDPQALTEVSFPDAERQAYLQPVLLWRATAAEDGPFSFRLSYAAQGVTWDASYEAVLSADGAAAFLSGRVGLANESGGRFQDTRVKLVSTPKGNLPPVFPSADEEPGLGARPAPALRYAYGQEEPSFERDVAGAGTLDTFDLPRALTVEPGQTKYIQLCAAEAMPVSRFYVYDGVRFDRFQRNRRNDWNFGTESHGTVETHFQFGNTKESGLGFKLPPGRFRVCQQRDDGLVDLLGEQYIPATEAGATVQVLLGPARGLRGERERTGYSEITPLHEYEESFEIRLENDTAQEVEVRVVEHLYRWNQYEIVKADTEYTAAGLQTVEFRPVLKPGGKRSVHYTVRYRW